MVFSWLRHLEQGVISGTRRRTLQRPRTRRAPWSPTDGTAAVVQQLEQRRLLTGPTSVDDLTVGISPDGIDSISLPVILADTAVTTDGDGNLVIEDNTLLGSDDLLTITADNPNSKFIIHDPNKSFGTDIAGATISPDGHTVEVPFASVPGPKVVVNTELGNDSATFNALGGPFGKGLDVDAGLGIDVVTIVSPVSGGLADISIINAETINLAANLSTDGGDVSLDGAVIVQAAVVIDTEAGNNGDAGNVDLAGTIAGDNNTRSLTINASSTGGPGGGTVTLDSIFSVLPATELVSLDLISTGPATISGVINVSQDVTVTAGDLDLTGSINADGIVTLQPFGVAAIIDLGSNTPGRFGITDAELDLIVSPSVVVGNLVNVAAIIETATISQPGRKLELISGGDITRTVGEIQGDDLSMRAGGKIGDSAVRMRTNVTNLEAQAGAAGIFITEADAVVVGGVSPLLTGLATTVGDGPIHLITGGAMVIDEAVTASGTGDVTLQSFTGAIALGDDVATMGDIVIVAGGAITQSEGCIEGESAALIGTNIGTPANRVCTDVNSLEALASAGGIFITELSAVTLGGASVGLTGLQTTGANGTVHLISGGTQTVSEAIAAHGSGAVILQSYSGAINLGADVTTAGNAALVAGAAITRTAGTVNAANLVLDAVSNIGTMANRVQTAAANLDAVAGGAGMFLAEANAIEIGGASASLTGLATRAGNTAIDLQANGAIIVSEVVRSTGTGILRLAANGGDLTINAGMASTFGNVTLNATGAGSDVAVNVAVGSDTGQIGITAGQDVAIGSHVIATNNTSTVTAANAITRTNGFVKGLGAALDAGTNIGSSGSRVWTQVSNLEARAMNGGLFLTEADGVTIGGASAGLTGLQTNAANGPIHLVTGGALTVSEDIEANGTGNVTLQSYTSDIALGADVTTAGDVAVVAGGAISHLAGTISGDDLTLVASTNVGASLGATRVQTNVNRLEAYAGNGGIFITEANGLTLGGIGNSLPLALESNGVNSDIELLVTAGALAIGDGIQTDTNGTTRLRAAGNITQTDGIVTNMLGVVSDAGTINLSATTNGVSEFAARAAGAGQSVYYQDLSDLMVNTISAGGVFAGLLNGVSAGHDVELLSAGSLTVQRAIQAGAGLTDTVRLKSNSGSVTQTVLGAITGRNFSVQAGTIINLSAANNDVDVFAAAAGSAPVQFNDPDGNTIGTVNGGVLITNSVTGVTP